MDSINADYLQSITNAKDIYDKGLVAAKEKYEATIQHFTSQYNSMMRNIQLEKERKIVKLNIKQRKDKENEVKEKKKLEKESLKKEKKEQKKKEDEEKEERRKKMKEIEIAKSRERMANYDEDNKSEETKSIEKTQKSIKKQIEKAQKEIEDFEYEKRFLKSEKAEDWMRKQKIVKLIAKREEKIKQLQQMLEDDEES
jgi:hypothetical protein